MSDASYNPFLQRNSPAPPLGSAPAGGGLPSVPPEVGRDAELVDDFEDEAEWDEGEEEIAPHRAIPFEYAFDSNDKTSKWFWSFFGAMFVSAVLIAVVVQLLIAPLLAMQFPFVMALMFGGTIGGLYGIVHASWKSRQLCTGIRIDDGAITLSFGSRKQAIDPLSVDAVMALSGIDLNGEGRGFSNLRRIVLLCGAKPENLSFEPISNGRIYAALREVCVHAWAIPSEGSLLPPRELAEHHADRSGIDSLRRLRKYYWRFVMQLLFSSVALIVLLLTGGGLMIAGGNPGMRHGIVRLVIFGGGLVIAAFSSLLRLPRELAVMRKLRETEKSLAVALGIEFGG